MPQFLCIYNIFNFLWVKIFLNFHMIIFAFSHIDMIFTDYFQTLKFFSYGFANYFYCGQRIYCIWYIYILGDILRLVQHSVNFNKLFFKHLMYRSCTMVMQFLILVSYIESMSSNVHMQHVSYNDILSMLSHIYDDTLCDVHMWWNHPMIHFSEYSYHRFVTEAWPLILWPKIPTKVMEGNKDMFCLTLSEGCSSSW